MYLSINLLDFSWWSYALSEYLIHPVITLLLCLLSVFVVLGNLLVVSAIWHESQLHSVTNYLIASLAAADCLVGAVVMPFSVISEIIVGSWTFGPTWCDLWHSFDVLASTASIMNLCAISLDRYLAITDPISYPSRMTPKRVALLIVFVWTVSSVISFPAIIWWRAVGPGPLQQILPPTATVSATTTTTATTISPSSLSSAFINNSQNPYPEVLQYRCVFTDDRYYLLFSSFVSFYGPLCIMLYAYYRIYKAAVQQTRFLKHGSKEVMIGRNRKAKRSRYISDHIHGAKEKKGITEASGSGPSSTGNYDRQHLVLRAHRGGGAGCGGTSSISKNSIAENNSTTNKSCSSVDQKRRANHKLELVTSKNLIESTTEAMKREGAQTSHQISNDLDQSITSKSDCPVPRSSQVIHTRDSKIQNHGPNSRARIELTSSKRDKLKVECQRFDSKSLKDVPNSNITTSITTTATTTVTINKNTHHNHHQEITKTKPYDLKFDLVIDFDGDAKKDFEKTNTDSKREPSKTSSIKSNHVTQFTKQMGKPLVASINNRSTNVDVSIINHPASPSTQTPTSTLTPTLRITKVSAKEPRMVVSNSTLGSKRTSASNIKVKRPLEYQTDSSFINVRHKCETNRNGSLGYVIDVDANEGSSEDVAGSGGSVSSINSNSSNSSSGSYGTGSIASVMTRSQNQHQNHHQHQHQTQATQQANEKTYIKSSCDNNVNNQVNPKLRRALSFGESRFKESWSKYRPHEDSSKNGKKFFTSPDETSNVSFDSYQTSHGGLTCNRKSLDAISSLKSGKALNFRSWVKLTKGHTRRNDSQQNNRQMKPPSSLLPLMMMNSDTSTDSSTVTGTTKQLDRAQRKTDDTVCRIVDVDKTLTSNCNTEHHLNEETSTEGQQNYQLQPLSKEKSETLVTDNQKDKNLSFREDPERGDGRSKGQMLYYDSDKLIQSIVDLTAIHYIDCTNQTTKYSEAHIDCPSDTIDNEVERSHIDSTVDTVQISRTSRSNLPRQHRVKKFNKLAKERKAAKTLGIVVGVFILCWLPFFVVNIVIAICGTNSIYNLQLFVSIVTWLGWLNSAMNPVIYACWSRDFRRAFRKVLCTWVELVCPYDGSSLAKKLKLKKCSNYSAQQETYLNRTVSSIKGNTSSVTTRSGVSIEGRGYNSINGSVSRSLLSEH